MDCQWVSREVLQEDCIENGSVCMVHIDISKVHTSQLIINLLTVSVSNHTRNQHFAWVVC